MPPATSENRVSSRRVGDEERHKTAEILSDHHAHGRLSQEEFEDRLGAALTAQTTAELGVLLADLPLRLDVEVTEPRRHSTDGWPKRPTRSRVARRSAAITAALGGVSILSLFTYAAAWSHEVFWGAFGSGFFGLVAGGVLGWSFRRGRDQGRTIETPTE